MVGISLQQEDSLFDSMLLADAIRKLPVRQRVVVSLRFAGYTQQECGTILGLTRAAIGIIHKRAVKGLRIRIFEAITEQGGKHASDNA